jgi:ATP-binding cassette, subfamily C (CFTR/MRP), member 1
VATEDSRFPALVSNICCFIAYKLQDLNVNIPAGSMTAVVGIVGSGKSSLISAILGEVHKLKGKIRRKGKVAYVPQIAW